MISTDITNIVPTNVDVIPLPVWQDVWRKVERSVSGVRQYVIEWSALARNEAAIDVIYRHYHNIVERSETVVIQIMKIVDCHVH